MNKKLKQVIDSSTCSIFIGDRGSGKSCLMALACQNALKGGYKVFCNYPYKGAFRIPYKEYKTKYKTKLLLDKDFLYNADLSDSLVMIDEARTVWNARAYADWTEQDEDFFNLIRKTNTKVILATQRYDGLDLNIRCAADMTFFIQRHSFFRNISTVDISRTTQVKIADKNTQVVSRGYSKNAHKVVYDVAELPRAYSWFWRKPYYDDFDTRYLQTSYDKSIQFELWENGLINDSDAPDINPQDITELLLGKQESNNDSLDEMLSNLK